MKERRSHQAGIDLIIDVDVKSVAWKVNRAGYLVRSHYLGMDSGGRIRYTTLIQHRVRNLELWSTHQPMGQRIIDKIRWAKEFLRQYEPEALSGKA